MDRSHHELKRQAQRQDGLVEKNAPNAPATATKPVRHYRAYLFQIYLLAAVLGFGTLFFLARTNPYFSFDLTIERAVQSLQWSGFGALMWFVTVMGFAPQSYIWAGAIIIALFLMGLRWEALTALFAAGGVSLLGTIIKEFVQRARPTSDLVRVFSIINEYSFPSGHVLFYTAFLGFLAFLLYTLAPRSWLRTLGIIILVTLIVLVGISRIYLGQHWPSDVMGAYLLGSLWLALTVYLYRWGKPRFFVHQRAAPEQPGPGAVVKK